MAEGRFASLADQVHALLKNGRLEDLRTLLPQYQPAEIADEFEEFSPEEQLGILSCLPTDMAVDVFESLEEQDQMELLNRFRRERQETFLREMEPDERADLFQALPKDLADKFMAMLPREDKEEVRELVAYGSNTAGGLMTPEFASVSPEMTVAEAIERFRQNYSELEMVYYLYVLDSEQRLVGLVSIRQLLLREPHEKIEDIMFRNVISVTPETDQEEVARILTLYDLYALPVVESSKKMLGIVTFDDVADVMSEEAAEDLEKFGAVSPGELSYGRRSVWEHMRGRVPWLVYLLVLSSISGFIILHAQKGYHGENLFIVYGMLVALYPMLTATAGNAGCQVAAQMIRGIATGEIKAGHGWRVLSKELRVSVAMGIVLVVLGFGRVMLTSTPQHWLFLGCSVGMALVAMLVIANLMGALLPLLFDRLGWDPALMSGPLIATLTDILSAIVYFTIAREIFKILSPLV